MIPMIQEGLIEWLEMDDFQKCLDVNYLGVVRVTKASTHILVIS